MSAARGRRGAVANKCPLHLIARAYTRVAIWGTTSTCSREAFGFIFLGRLCKISLLFIDHSLHIDAWPSKHRARVRDDVVSIRNARSFNRRNRLRRKRRRRNAVDHKREINLSDAKPDQIFRCKGGLEHHLQYFRIKRADAETDRGTDVAENRIPYLLFHLLNVLVG